MYTNNITRSIMLLSVGIFIIGCQSFNGTKSAVADDKNLKPKIIANAPAMDSATCIQQLSALKTLSIEDHDALMSSFQEVSEINQLYKDIKMTTSPESTELLKMSIESKTKILCAKVRYYSVISTQSIIDKAVVL